MGGDWGKRGLRESEFLLPCVLPIVDEFYNVDAFRDRKGGEVPVMSIPVDGVEGVRRPVVFGT